MNFTFKSIDHYQLASPKNTEDQSRKFFNGILMFREVKKPLSLSSNGGLVRIGIDQDSCRNGG
ncbi:hypothetical protein [Peribacillus simplex]|uniref:hypothetical protein n=1 Tax=Peribacillus simplex TaxID=1478 RepID=UPI00296E477C|nr:hypothetical protein [Peribacillus simplex]